MSRYDFWTHGVSTFVEIEDIDQDIGLDVRHKGLGTKIRAAGTFSDRIVRAWLHIPITTPTILGGDESIKLKYLHLKGWLDNSGHINKFHVRQSDNDPLYKENIERDDLKGYPDRLQVSRRIDTPDTEINEGLVLSIHVEFQNPRSIVEIVGVGARFDK